MADFGIGEFVSIVGAAFSAVSSVAQGQAAQSAANANADAQREAALQEQQVGAEQAANDQSRAKRLQSAQITAMGAGGVDPTTGTADTMLTQTSEQGWLAAKMDINNAARRAWGLNTSADITQATGNQMATAGWIKGGSTLLGAASKSGFFGSSFKSLSLYDNSPGDNSVYNG